MENHPAKVPPIKIQGIKTKLVPFIRGSIASNSWSGRWVEPFMGSGVVAFNVIPKRALLADTNPHIIQFYKDMQSGRVNARTVREYLEEEGTSLYRIGESHYYAIRERFNDAPNSLDFLFLNRACFNGVMRFNKKGRFNVPFCRKPERFRGAYVTKISNQVATISAIIRAGEYTFVCQDWRHTLDQMGSGDFAYVDPPYAGRHTDYFNSWDDAEEEALAATLKGLAGGFGLSTWLSNKYRINESVERLYDGFDVRTEAHFYHVGSHEALRNEMIEALIIKPGYGQAYTPKPRKVPAPGLEAQTSLF